MVISRLFKWRAYAPEKPYTSRTLISKSPLGHSGGLLKVEQRSVLPNLMFSSIQIAWPSPPPMVIIFESAAMKSSEP